MYVKFSDTYSPPHVYTCKDVYMYIWVFMFNPRIHTYMTRISICMYRTKHRFTWQGQHIEYIGWHRCLPHQLHICTWMKKFIIIYIYIYTRYGRSYRRIALYIYVYLMYILRTTYIYNSFCVLFLYIYIYGYIFIYIYNYINIQRHMYTYTHIRQARVDLIKFAATRQLESAMLILHVHGIRALKWSHRFALSGSVWLVCVMMAFPHFRVDLNHGLRAWCGHSVGGSYFTLLSILSCTAVEWQHVFAQLSRQNNRSRLYRCFFLSLIALWRLFLTF